MVYVCILDLNKKVLRLGTYIEKNPRKKTINLKYSTKLINDKKNVRIQNIC